MDGNIRAYIDELFNGTTPSRKSVELKEEMIQNLTEKYNDLLSEGKSPEAAYNVAIASIGDVSALLKDLENDSVDPAVLTMQRQKTAMLTAIAIMMYIVSVVPLIILAALVGSTSATITGVVIMFILCAVATGMLVYNHMSKPKYIKEDDTMVEDFRKWQSDTHDKKTMNSAVTSAMWSLLVALYFIVSFATGAWYITWVIFIIGAAIQSILKAAFAMRK